MNQPLDRDEGNEDQYVRAGHHPVQERDGRRGQDHGRGQPQADTRQGQGFEKDNQRVGRAKVAEEKEKEEKEEEKEELTKACLCKSATTACRAAASPGTAVGALSARENDVRPGPLVCDPGERLGGVAPLVGSLQRGW